MTEYQKELEAVIKWLETLTESERTYLYGCLLYGFLESPTEWSIIDQCQYLGKKYYKSDLNQFRERIDELTDLSIFPNDIKYELLENLEHRKEK